MKCQGFWGPCDRTDATLNRQNTSYVHDKKQIKLKYVANGEVEKNTRNHAVLCPECQKESDKYWKEMWSEYYSAIMPVPVNFNI